MTARLASRRVRQNASVPAFQKGLFVQSHDEGEVGDGRDGARPKSIIREGGFSDPKFVPASLGRNHAAPPAVADHPPAYRKIIAAWTDDWRERWGLRANSLEEIGLAWREAETQAFVEVWKQIRDTANPDSAIAVLPPDLANAGLN